jgi:hypothetical protein
MKDDWLRISRGPWRAPARFVVPPSHGTPMRAISMSEGSSVWGNRMKVGMPPKRGTTYPLKGLLKLSGMALAPKKIDADRPWFRLPIIAGIGSTAKG